MNKKGYTLIEIVVVLALSSIFLLSAYSVTSFSYGKVKDYNEFSDTVSDKYHIKKTLSKDIVSSELEKLDENTVKIGSHIYEFSNVIKRDSIEITENKYSFIVKDSTIEIFNDNFKVSYTTKSSFEGVN